MRIGIHFGVPKGIKNKCSKGLVDSGAVLKISIRLMFSANNEKITIGLVRGLALTLSKCKESAGPHVEHRVCIGPGLDHVKMLWHVLM